MEKKMKLLITGGGGREHAMALKLSLSKNVETIFCAPGNGATERIDKCVNLRLDTLEDILSFAESKEIDLTIPGAETLLVEGIVDAFQAKGLPIFGPHREAAMLEGSKGYAKGFMKKYGIRTANYQIFNSSDEALRYIDKADFPIVVKADGLAAGKGVLICNSKDEALEGVKKIMVDGTFGEAGRSIVIEDYLEGVEASILSVFDGKNIIPFISAKDHKKIGEGEMGLNTGGMGVIAPNPHMTDSVFQDFYTQILNPTLMGLKNEKLEFSGIIFFGLMITLKGIYLLEYNLRMGDPETQAVLPLLESDFLNILSLSIKGNLESKDIVWSGEHSCAVVQVSGGYPEKYEKGYEIHGADEDQLVYISGAERRRDRLYTSGGRVLTVVGTADSARGAREAVYQRLDKIHFKDHYYRKDIGNFE